MLYRLSRLPVDMLSLIVFTDSPSLEYVYLSMIRDKFDIHSDYCVSVTTEKELTHARSSINITPLRGKRWLLSIDADKIDMKVLERVGSIAYDSCLVLYHTTRYGTYKRLLASKFREAQGRYCTDLYGGRLDRRDIELIAKHYEVMLEETIVKFLEHKYGRTPQSICTLCSLVKSGYCITSDKDVIEAVGLGSISVDDFVLSLLTSRINTSHGLKRAIKQKLMYLSNLAEGIPYNSIQNFIVDTLAGMIDIKLAMIAGELSILNNSPPSSYTDKRAARFKRLLRYRATLESDISLEYLLRCHSLFKKNIYNPKLAILEWILKLYSIEGITEEPKSQRIDVQVPVGGVFDMTKYDKFGCSVIYTQKAPSKSKQSATSSPSKAKESSSKATESVDNSTETEVSEPITLLSLLMGTT